MCFDSAEWVHVSSVTSIFGWTVQRNILLPDVNVLQMCKPELNFHLNDLTSFGPDMRITEETN